MLEDRRGIAVRRCQSGQGHGCLLSRGCGCCTRAAWPINCNRLLTGCGDAMNRMSRLLGLCVLLFLALAQQSALVAGDKSTLQAIRLSGPGVLEPKGRTFLRVEGLFDGK